VAAGFLRRVRRPPPQTGCDQGDGGVGNDDGQEPGLFLSSKVPGSRFAEMMSKQFEEIQDWHRIG